MLLITCLAFEANHDQRFQLEPLPSSVRRVWRMPRLSVPYVTDRHEQVITRGRYGVSRGRRREDRHGRAKSRAAEREQGGLYYGTHREPV